ncbi:MAG: nitroreductase [Candidatus Methylomirabilota bacterium]
MDVHEAILTRRSIRAFRAEPVPAAMLQEIIKLARWTPSFANTQSWEFTVVGGEVLAELRRRLREAAIADPAGRPEIPWPELPEKYHARRREVGLAVFRALGVAGDDTKAREAWRLAGIGFFGAPHVIVCCAAKCLRGWGMYDAGAAAQSLMLAAHAKGLGTCPQAAPIRQPGIFRELLEIPADLEIVLAMPVGFPDREAPVNRFARTRVPLTELLHWKGMEPTG